MIYNFKNRNSKKNFLNKFNNNLFDIIIIGTGPAAYLLYENIKDEKNILIIERGSLNFENNLNEKNYRSIISNENYKIKKDSRIFSFGGAGNVWGGVASYIENFEMKDRWFNNKNLWPIEHKEITSYYKNLKEKYGFNTKSQIINLKKKGNENSIFKERSFYAETKPFRFNDLDHYKKSHLLINAKVEYLDNKKNKNLVILKQDNQKIYSKKIVICCGGLETNFLILRSIKNKKLKKAFNKKIVGKFFMDHPKFDLGFAKFNKENEKLIKRIQLKKKGSYFTYKGLSINEKLQKKKKLVNSYVRFEKYLYLDLKNKIKKVKMKNDFLFKNFSLVKLYFKIFLLFLLQIFKKDTLVEKYKITIFNEMVPRKNNRIIYMKKKNKEKFKILYNFSKTEFKTIFYLIKKLKKLKGVNINLNNICSKKNIVINLKDSSHHIGGTIMGNNFKNSFVNKNLEVHGVKNVYICSTSVFPSSGSVNPTMTLCSLAIRLGNFLSSKKYSR